MLGPMVTATFPVAAAVLRARTVAASHVAIGGDVDEPAATVEHVKSYVRAKEIAVGLTVTLPSLPVSPVDVIMSAVELTPDMRDAWRKDR
ncbi:MAG: hypothetical protein R3D01_05355 [Hyphomicrobiales bacterium]